nr:hypothetical protein [Tanacetum cinerariifolium]
MHTPYPESFDTPYTSTLTWAVDKNGRPRIKGTSSSSGISPRRKETMGGTSAQTRSERVLKQPNEPPLIEGHTSRSGEGRMEHTAKLTNTVPPTLYDSPLTGGYTPGSDEGRLKLEELMNLCIILLNRVTTFENKLSSTKAVYHKAFITLTKRVKKLEIQLKQKRSRAVIHSSDEEEPSVDIKDSPKQGRMIEELDKDEDINLVSKQGEVHETAELLKDDDDVTLAETLLNIKRKLAKEITRQEQEKYNIEKALELQRKLDKREEDVDKGDQTKEIDWNDPILLRYHALQNIPFSKAETLEIDNLKHIPFEHLKEKESLEQKTELSAEQAFWSQNSGNYEEPNLSSSTTIVEVPKELPKVSMRIRSLSGNEKEEKIKRELEEIETINIELDHKVTKLVDENEHLKQTYKQLYDLIKSSRVRSKEQCDNLIKQVNIKSAKNSDLNACLQEKVLVITALKDT